MCLQGVMDYSLLIGVHNRKFRIDDPAAPPPPPPAAPHHHPSLAAATSTGSVGGGEGPGGRVVVSPLLAGGAAKWDLLRQAHQQARLSTYMGSPAGSGMGRGDEGFGGGGGAGAQTSTNPLHAMAPSPPSSAAGPAPRLGTVGRRPTVRLAPLKDLDADDGSATPTSRSPSRPAAMSFGSEADGGEAMIASEEGDDDDEEVTSAGGVGMSPARTRATSDGSGGVAPAPVDARQPPRGALPPPPPRAPPPHLRTGSAGPRERVTSPLRNAVPPPPAPPASGPAEAARHDRFALQEVFSYANLQPPPPPPPSPPRGGASGGGGAGASAATAAGTGLAAAAGGSGGGHATSPFFRTDEGGIASSIIEGPGVFYMGIIDILQVSVRGGGGGGGLRCVEGWPCGLQCGGRCSVLAPAADRATCVPSSAACDCRLLLGRCGSAAGLLSQPCW
jgi:hypothetical protein